MEESHLENESPNLESIAKKLLDGGPSSAAVIPSQSSKDSVRKNVRARPLDLAKEELGKPSAKRLKVSQEECISVKSSQSSGDESVEVLSANNHSSVVELKKVVDQASSKN